MNSSLISNFEPNRALINFWIIRCKSFSLPLRARLFKRKTIVSIVLFLVTQFLTISKIVLITATGSLPRPVRTARLPFSLTE